MTCIIDPDGVETRIVHELVDFHEKDVLEIGCGDGRMTRAIGSRARSVVAIDPDPSEIEMAHGSTPGPGPRISFRVADSRTLDLPAETVDVAYFSGSL